MKFEYTQHAPHPVVVPEVDYFGMKLEGVFVGWLSVDKNRYLHWSKHKPETEDYQGLQHHDRWYSIGRYESLGTVDLEGMDWKDTLMEVQAKPVR